MKVELGLPKVIFRIQFRANLDSDQIGTKTGFNAQTVVAKEEIQYTSSSPSVQTSISLLWRCSQ